MKALILAAGYATRLMPLTSNKPKALLEINNKPIINYIIESLEKIKEINEIYVVSNEKFYLQFLDWTNGIKNNNVKILNDGTTSEENRRGAIGDIQFSIEKENIYDDLIVIAGDNFFTFDLEEYYNFFKTNELDCVCAKEINDIETLKRFGVGIVDQNNKLLELEEKPQNPKSNLGIYATYIYKKSTLPLVKEYLDLGNNKDAPGYFIEWLCKRRNILVYKFLEDCYDIGTVESYNYVNKLFTSNKNK